ncbi:hypothetical protein HOLleu_12705 [Holothuria leucospilota]|uniref:Uncharacterized protein n=1 Tax=Holothuria leucospilota TaxID=206669 RepID=A0A9Q1CBC8_HOLLE|nr:hypothetical protein HOLleu_12705 [Holothuria leucospilota]
MNGSILSDVTFEKDLGVVITGDLKPSRQCAAAAARANRVLGLIKRNFSSFSKEIVLNLYKQLVTPHLDYAAQAWSPFYEKDKLLLEQVQRRATRLIPEVRHLPYLVQEFPWSRRFWILTWRRSIRDHDGGAPRVGPVLFSQS